MPLHSHQIYFIFPTETVSWLLFNFLGALFYTSSRRWRFVVVVVVDDIEREQESKRLWQLFDYIAESPYADAAVGGPSLL